MGPERSALAGRRGGGIGGQQDRPGRRGRTRLALRLAGGGLLIAAGAIHLDLYLTGYRSIPVIGWLFLCSRASQRQRAQPERGAVARGNRVEPVTSG